MININFDNIAHYSIHNNKVCINVPEYLTSFKYNDYTPIQAISDGTVIKRGEDKDLIYSLRTFERCDIDNHFINVASNEQSSISSILISKYDILVDVFLNQKNKLNYFKTTTMPCPIVVGHGILQFEDSFMNITPLLVLAYKSKYVFDIVRSMDLDNNNLALFVNKSLLINEEYKLLYRNLTKKLIAPIIDSGIDVIYTNDIKKFLFNKPDYIPKFSNIIEMKNHLKGINEILINELPNEY